MVGDVELGAERVPGDGLAVLLVLGGARRCLTTWDKHSATPATPASLSAGSPGRPGSPKATPAVSENDRREVTADIAAAYDRVLVTATGPASIAYITEE